MGRRLLIFLNALDLIGFELDRCLASEHRNEHFYLAALLIYLTDLTIEVLERAVNDDDGIALCEVDGMTHGVALCALQYLVDFLLGERYRLIGSADEPRHLRRIAHDAPRIIRRYHIDEHVAGEYLLFGLGLTTILYLYLLLRGDDDIEDLIGHAKTFHALFQITRDGIFVARVRVYCVPLSIG